MREEAARKLGVVRPGHKKIKKPLFWLLALLAVLAGTALLCYYWRVVFSLPANVMLPLWLLMALVGSAALAAVFGLLQLPAQKRCLRAALCMGALGLLFCFATPPLQAPDEVGYFLRAEAMSRGDFIYDGEQRYPDDVSHLVNAFPGAFNHRISYAGGQLAPAAFSQYEEALASGQRVQRPAGAPIVFMLLPFLHQAGAMALARALGFSALGLLYAARMANLAVYCAICCWALKNCEQYREVFTAVAMLPLSLFLAASCSSDALVISLCLLMVSYLFKPAVTNKDLVFYTLALCLASYIKPVNLIFALLLLAIPAKRWRARPDKRLVAILLMVVPLVVTQAAALFDGGVLKQGWPDELPRGSGEAADPKAQMLFTLQHLPRFASVAVLSIIDGSGYLFNLGTFGWMDLSLPIISGLSVASLSASSVLGARLPRKGDRQASLVLLIIGAVYAAGVLAGMYFFDTDLYAIRISGVQPRYFLPAFLLLFLLLSLFAGRFLRVRRPVVDFTEGAMMWAAAALALCAVVMLFEHYYVGQWLTKADGGHKMVNLLGWQIT